MKLILVIASKCDDISCSEVIRALNLDDDPELEGIEERISQYARETREWKHKKAEAEQTAKSTVTLIFPSVMLMNIISNRYQ